MPVFPFCPHCGALNPPSEEKCFACGQTLANSASAVLSQTSGQRLLRQRYRLLQQIGAGGFGAVYKAEDTQLDNRLVAVKEMGMRGLTPEETQEATESFRREALLLARLSHPNLPRIHEQFEEDGRWYLVMDYIQGQTLEDYLKDCGGSLSVKEVLQLGLQLTSVLSYLHTRQPPIVFRDLKPSNVMRTSEGQIYLIDFGIARLFKPGQAKDTTAFGSPGYAAPEQYGTAQTTPRSDVFSLGALLHHLLTGIDPSDTPFRFKPLTMPRPADLPTLIERMVDLDAAKRPATMELVRQSLERMVQNPAPWRTEGQDLAQPGVLLHLTQASTGVFPPVAPSAPSWQSQNTGPFTHAEPVLHPPPITKKWKVGRWIAVLVMLCLVGYVALSGLGLHSTANHPVSSPGTGYQDTPTATPMAPAPTGLPVSAVSWSPDGAYIASGGDDSKVEVWDVASNHPKTVLDASMAYVNALAWSPDSRYLAVGGQAGEVQIWKADGTLVNGYRFSSSNIISLSWSPDSQQIALASQDGILRVVDALTGNTSTTYKAGSGGPMIEVAWSPDGKYIAYGSEEQSVDVWNSVTGKAVYTYNDTQAPVAAFAWSPDSERIASVDLYSQVQVWDALTGDHLLTYTDQSDIFLTALGWSPNGHYLALGNDDGRVDVWMPGANNALYTYSQQTDTINAVAWSPDSKRIASASLDGTVQIWDAMTGGNVVTYDQP